MTKVSQEEKDADREWRAGSRGPRQVVTWCWIVGVLALMGGALGSMAFSSGVPFGVGIVVCVQCAFTQVVFSWMAARYEQTERLIQRLPRA